MMAPPDAPDSIRVISAAQPLRCTRGFQADRPSSTNTSPSGRPRLARTARQAPTWPVVLAWRLSPARETRA